MFGGTDDPVPLNGTVKTVQVSVFGEAATAVGGVKFPAIVTVAVFVQPLASVAVTV